MFALAVVANDYDMISSDYRAARRVPAWLMSVGLHTCLLVACALLIRSPVKGPRVETDRNAGIALVQRSEAETSYFTEEDLDATATVTATSATDSSSQPTSLPETSIEFAVQLPSSNELSSGAGLGQVLPGASGFTTGGEGARNDRRPGSDPSVQRRRYREQIHLCVRSLSQHGRISRPSYGGSKAATDRESERFGECASVSDRLLQRRDNRLSSRSFASRRASCLPATKTKSSRLSSSTE